MVEEGIVAKDEIKGRVNSEGMEGGRADAEAPWMVRRAETPCAAFAASLALWLLDAASDISVE
jgi:hypothetical protein